MNKIKVKEIIEESWLILSCGFWAILATFRGLQTRYLTWRISRLELEDNHLTSTIDEEQEAL